MLIYCLQNLAKENAKTCTESLVEEILNPSFLKGKPSLILILIFQCSHFFVSVAVMRSCENALHYLV